MTAAGKDITEIGELTVLPDFPPDVMGLVLARPLTKRDQEIIDAQESIRARQAAKRAANRRVRTAGAPDRILRELAAKHPDDPRYRLPNVDTIAIPTEGDASIARLAGCGIYLLDWGVPGTTYVGQSVCIADRLGSHVAELKAGTHGNGLMQAIYRDLGFGPMRVRVLEHCDVSLLGIREQQWIRRLRPTLNIAEVGCRD